LGDMRHDLAPTAIHRGRREEGEIGRQPGPPADVGEGLHCGIQPTLGKHPKLLSVKGGRPSLSQSLWPAEPPEERERGPAGQRRGGIAVARAREGAEREEPS
jgi:hypothetical protein